jgi:Holliday junction resolvase
MSSSPYLKGVRFEYRVQRWLRHRGWFVVRQPRSAFPDLVALRKGKLVLVECRVGGSLSRKERRHLVSLARKELGGEALLAQRNGGSLVLKRISPTSGRRDVVVPHEMLAAP